LYGRKIQCEGRRIPTDVHDAIVTGLEKTNGVKQVSPLDINEILSTDWVVTVLRANALGQAIEKASGGKVRRVGWTRAGLQYEMAPVPPPPQPPPVLPPSPLTPPGEVSPPFTIVPSTAPSGPSVAPTAGTQGASTDDASTISALRRITVLLDNPPAWLLPAAISAVAVVGAFVAGILVARRKGRGRRPD